MPSGSEKLDLDKVCCCQSDADEQQLHCCPKQFESQRQRRASWLPGDRRSDRAALKIKIKCLKGQRQRQGGHMDIDPTL